MFTFLKRTSAAKMAKSVVQIGCCERALIQFLYAIGVAQSLSWFMEAHGVDSVL